MKLKELSETIARENLPAVVVDLEVFEKNIKRVADILSQKSSKASIRIATKSIRVPDLISKILAHGPPFRGLMTFAVQETHFLAGLGFDDFLIAYPTFQDSDYLLLRQLHDNGKKVQLIIDHIEQIKKLNQFFEGSKTSFPILFEVDSSLRLFGGKVHIGGRRSAIRDVTTLCEYLDILKKFKNLKFGGIMIYESQIAGIGDSNPVNFWMNPMIRLMKTLSRKKVSKLRSEIVATLKTKGIPLDLFNGGGTGSLIGCATESALTEITVGSGFLCPHLFDYYNDLKFEPAFFFGLQVTRQSDKGWVTCNGGGYVASGRPGVDKIPKPVYPMGVRFKSDEAGGEVQTPISSPESIALGSAVLFRHAKGGELAERFLEYLLVSKNGKIERVKTYRGYGECYF